MPRSAVLSLWLMLLLAGGAYAQTTSSTTGAIDGRVTDSSSAVLPGVVGAVRLKLCVTVRPASPPLLSAVLMQRVTVSPPSVKVTPVERQTSPGRRPTVTDAGRTLADGLEVLVVPSIVALVIVAPAATP